MEKGLEAALYDELSYSKDDCKNKDTDNSRNGYSSNTLRTSFGDVIDLGHPTSIGCPFMALLILEYSAPNDH